MQYSICYISTATTTFEEDDIRKLLDQWKEKNGKLKDQGYFTFLGRTFFPGSGRREEEGANFVQEN